MRNRTSGAEPAQDVGGVSLRRWARKLKRDVLALWIAARDRRTPWIARIAATAVAAYALSPLDLIPDFIPVLGYLDDLLIVPLGIALCLKLIPPDLMSEYRKAAAELAVRPLSLAGGVAIVLVWLALIYLAVSFLLPQHTTKVPDRNGSI